MTKENGAQKSIIGFHPLYAGKLAICRLGLDCAIPLLTETKGLVEIKVLSNSNSTSSLCISIIVQKPTNKAKQFGFVNQETVDIFNWHLM